MDNEELRSWLMERGLTAEATTGVVNQADEIKEMYAGLVGVGGAIGHEEWLGEITTTGHENDPLDQVVWFLLGLTASVISLVED